MKKFLKVLGILLLVLVLAGGGLVLYITQALPQVAVQPDLKVEATPERVARGAYLANHICVCMDCHSTRDWQAYSGPLTPGTLGKGGERFDRALGFPGVFVSKNITPFALKDWSDGELYRAITSGVSRDGHPFFPVMPYPNYGKMDTEDIYSLIAYLRTLPPQASTPEGSEADFPVSIILRTIPEEPHPVAKPSPSDAVAYGAYLVNAAGCGECHTRAEKGKKVGAPFAGGFAFNFPNGSVVRSSNLTPHADGLGAWDKDTFIARFKQYADSAYVPPAVDWNAGDFQTVMPWTMYTGMTEQDLGAIWDYLRTLPAVAGKVEKWTPPPGR
ncbi:MAG: c-type cytochrome [Bacteroidetes bacterium]|nr:c-type cytochrome [Bacteroidota bacterium]